MTTRSSLSSNNGGTYALVIYLSTARKIRIGRLGTFNFPRGYYLYIGSAMNGLTKRIARHLIDNRLATRATPSRNKKIFWHIDYLLEQAQVKEVMTHSGSERFECIWAQAALALPKARIVTPHFGSSDCKCAAHLIYFGNRPPEIRMKDEG